MGLLWVPFGSCEKGEWANEKVVVSKVEFEESKKVFVRYVSLCANVFTALHKKVGLPLRSSICTVDDCLGRLILMFFLWHRVLIITSKRVKCAIGILNLVFLYHLSSYMKNVPLKLYSEAFFWNVFFTLEKFIIIYPNDVCFDNKIFNIKKYIRCKWESPGTLEIIMKMV